MASIWDKRYVCLALNVSSPSFLGFPFLESARSPNALHFFMYIYTWALTVAWPAGSSEKHLLGYKRLLWLRDQWLRPLVVVEVPEIRTMISSQGWIS